jgi:hypothetical protein
VDRAETAQQLIELFLHAAEGYLVNSAVPKLRRG